MGHSAKKKRCISLCLTWWRQRRGCKWVRRSELLCSSWSSPSRCLLGSGWEDADDIKPAMGTDKVIWGPLSWAPSRYPGKAPCFLLLLLLIIGTGSTHVMVRIISLIYFPDSATMIKTRAVRQVSPDSPNYVISTLYYPLSYFLMLLFNALLPPFFWPNCLPHK